MDLEQTILLHLNQKNKSKKSLHPKSNHRLIVTKYTGLARTYVETRTAAVVESQLTKKTQAIVFIPQDHVSGGRGAAPASDHPGDPRANLRPRVGHAPLPTALQASIGAPKPVPKFAWGLQLPLIGTRLGPLNRCYIYGAMTGQNVGKNAANSFAIFDDTTKSDFH